MALRPTEQSAEERAREARHVRKACVACGATDQPVEVRTYEGSSLTLCVHAAACRARWILGEVLA